MSETRILIIEDEEPVRTSILELLDVEGYAVTGAEDGVIGIMLAQQQKPDLIICDVMMPQLDGYEVLKQLRQHPGTATIPFIFLTAKTGTGPLREGMNLGADDYLSKPFKRSDLLKTISVRLNKQASIEKQTIEQLEDLRANITQMLPHEFLTPLSVILMSSEILIKHQNSLNPDQRLEIAERINSTAERLRRLIQNFLLYAELQVVASDAEKLKTYRSCQTSLPGNIISEIVIARARQDNREADLKLKLSNATVQIATPRLRKLVEELIDNAFRYSTPGTPVHVTSDYNDGKYILYILDYGRGMHAEQLKRLGAYVQFERLIYEQQGSGLGLAISRRLAQVHGGELLVESSYGRQTLVGVALPTTYQPPQISAI